MARVALFALAFPLLAAVAPPPGTLNAVEGVVGVNGKVIDADMIGTASVRSGDVLRTRNGMAEVLVGRGTILRVGPSSQMSFGALAPDRAEARIVKGAASLEILGIAHPAAVSIQRSGGASVFSKPGLYFVSTTNKGVKELTAWSRERSRQLGRVTAETAEYYAANPSAWHGADWYWNMWSRSYTWLPSYARTHLPPFTADTDLYGIGQPMEPAPPEPAVPGAGEAPTVPLTAPGVPSFPNNR